MYWCRNCCRPFSACDSGNGSCKQSFDGAHVWEEVTNAMSSMNQQAQTGQNGCALKPPVDMPEFRRLEALIVSMGPFVQRYREMVKQIIGGYPDKSYF
jgi:hypothetical protein